MRIRWNNFELPSRVIVEKETLTDIFGRFIAEPFERGFGVTIGNSLRRILLSSIEGAAVASVKIDGVRHAFGTIPGIVEDVIDIILNIKNLNIKLHSEGPKTIKIEATKAGVIKGGDIITDSDVEIINKDSHIATLSKNIKFNVEMEVKRGRGYVTEEENELEEKEVGVISVDSMFSPVRNVQYKIEDTRVGHKTNYDRLIIDISTNGAITPEVAIVEASKILRKHLNSFVQYAELGKELDYVDTIAIENQNKDHEIEQSTKKLDESLDMNVSELDLSVRASNCLDMANIKNVRELTLINEEDALELRNFGKTTLVEIKKKLLQMGLSFGMDKPEMNKEAI
ncbi:MAG: DNA-directed RNA polymerase subunit alpha [Candidatus Anammoxibacter sp.]